MAGNTITEFTSHDNTVSSRQYPEFVGSGITVRETTALKGNPLPPYQRQGGAYELLNLGEDEWGRRTTGSGSRPQTKGTLN